MAYQPGRSRPDYCGIYHADVLTGVYAFGAIAAALYQRQGNGKGQHIDVSMLESMLSLTLSETQKDTYRLYQEGIPLGEIAARRGLKDVTVVTHLEELAAAGKEG